MLLDINLELVICLEICLEVVANLLEILWKLVGNLRDLGATLA